MLVGAAERLRIEAEQPLILEGLDDDSGLAGVRAVHGSCPQRSKLNFGRHLIGPQTARTLEELLDGSSVRLSLF